jgi:hypothetical protein
VVDLLIWEVVDGQAAKAKRKQTKRKSADQKTDWERNAAKLRSKERALRPQSPVKPVSHS